MKMIKKKAAQSFHPFILKILILTFFIISADTQKKDRPYQPRHFATSPLRQLVYFNQGGALKFYPSLN